MEMRFVDNGIKAWYISIIISQKMGVVFNSGIKKEPSF